MMEWVRSWLLSIIAMCALCALAQSLMPAGPVRQVGRLVCGLSIFLVILSPLVRVDMAQSQQWLDGYFTGLEWRREELQSQVDGQMKVIIEREYAAYIVDKAAEMGVDCTAGVECHTGEDGLVVPQHSQVWGRFTDAQQSQLTQLIQQELGIPREQQVYYREEELP